jgi:hypothetical protein
VSRQAPANGYDFGQKRQYRRTIWRHFANYFHGDRSDKQLLLMPSKEGDEIEVAKCVGFREENMHVVDKNPAIVASLTRRYPKITTYGVTVVNAVVRARRQGVRFHAVNLDLCTNLSNELVETVNVLGRSDVLHHGALVAVTCLRGRELNSDGYRNLVQKSRVVHGTPSWAGDYTEMDLARLGTIRTCLSKHVVSINGMLASQVHAQVHLTKVGKYRSGKQTMLYGVWCYHNDMCPCQPCVHERAVDRLSDVRGDTLPSPRKGEIFPPPTGHCAEPAGGWPLDFMATCRATCEGFVRGSSLTSKERMR